MVDTVANALAAVAELKGVGLRQCRHGPMLYLLNDRPIATALEAYGEWSEGEIGLLSRWVRPGDTVVEAGANIGTHTVPLAKLAGPSGRVVAIEPQRMMYQLLGGNLALNRLGNVDTYRVAVSDKPGPIDIPSVDYFGQVNNYSAMPLEDARNRKGYAGLDFETVPAITIDSLKLRTVRLIKMDVEGMEPQALRSARYLIERTRPILYLEADRPENYPLLAGLLRKYGYQAWWHVVPLFSPGNFAGAAASQTGSLNSLNIVCFPIGSEYEPPTPPQSFLDYVDKFGPTLPMLSGGAVE